MKQRATNEHDQHYPQSTETNTNSSPSVSSHSHSDSAEYKNEIKGENGEMNVFGQGQQNIPNMGMTDMNWFQNGNPMSGKLFRFDLYFLKVTWKTFWLQSKVKAIATVTQKPEIKK